ncbi:MAG: TldD/PmbA family protein [Candidatus Kariarchaeaceae archaeon]
MVDGVSYADLRIENSDYVTISVTNGEIKETSVGLESGLGVRVLKDGAWGFAYGSIPDFEEIVKMALSSVSLTQRFKKEDVSMANAKVVEDKVEVSFKINPLDVSIEDKVQMVLDTDKVIQGDDMIKSTNVGYRDVVKNIQFANNEGTRIEQVIPYVMMNASCTCKDAEGGTFQAAARLGHTGGLELFDKEPAQSVGERAMEDALAGIKAPKIKGGKYDCVLDGGMNGLFAHEACGHSAEGDFVRTAGVLRGKLGKKVAASNVSLVDDGSIQEIDGNNFFGFLPYDDEGVKTRRIDIIDDGVLKSYLNDRATAHYWEAEPTGNARAMFFSNQPIVRMRNTWLEATNDSMSQEELIEVVGNGLLLKTSKGGQVDPIRGTFNFGTGEIWLIENGEVTDRKRPTTAAGNTIQTLKSILGINNKFDNVTHSIGFCGKGGQAVPTSIGGGWMAVKNITIG